MIPTPDLSHLTSEDYALTYEPAEDTFLFLDALESDVEDLKNSRPLICLEIGSGSGCVSSFIGQILGPSVLYLCTDINPHACRCSQSTGKQNKVSLECVNTSFASPLMSRLRHQVDVVLFNPPYVPTEYEEAHIAQQAKSISGAWAGGYDGMQVTNTFLETVKDLLSDKGRFYLVALKQNNIPEIQRRMLDEHNLESEVVLQRRAGREHLFILRFTIKKKVITS
ncbi:S-adenosyl-L-methionine-dependent methyltransferase [Macrolepiota fuliginosa MF-IS2]|uniref:S-adenosyl-L-methionine-dependent methyltransferase n=1 Tax=Macrolepiota fuliginosa MF-IS2 TaxID=1400762 RepID=A0A9P5XMS6_9AGAR|nr:S-adenosyl-L-methionine-dependent methyltransferase [Macrolepiota fuliginosa MF-IS2]